MRLQLPCPCGSGTAYDGCCGRFVRGAAQPATPEELMRSRYTAHAVGETDHLFRTWHPRTRPADVQADPTVAWTGLVVHEAVGDEVEFTASYVHEGRPATLHERSLFTRRAGRWVYVEGTELP